MNIISHCRHVLLILALAVTAMAADGSKAGGEEQAFAQADQGPWNEVFSDPATGDWKAKWFLDGEIATVSTGPAGMTLTAGPEEMNDAHHMVLWTKESFAGDVKIEFDFTRLDDANRFVNILYIQATGSGKGDYHHDITQWNDLRKVPAMRTYYSNMNVYHASYAAYGNSGKEKRSYIRGRRYMPDTGGKLAGTELKPEYFSETLFATGVDHHITFIKKDRDIYIRVQNPTETFYGHMTNADFPVVTEGRIGLRQMFTRSSIYRNFRISKLEVPK